MVFICLIHPRAHINEVSSFERGNLVSEKQRKAKSCESRKPVSTVERSNAARTRLAPLQRARQIESDRLSFECLRVKKSVVARSRSLRNLEREPCLWELFSRFDTIVNVLKSSPDKVLFISTVEMLVEVKSDENAKLRKMSALERERGVSLQTTDGLVDGIPHTSSGQIGNKKEVETKERRPVEFARFQSVGTET